MNIDKRMDEAQFTIGTPVCMFCLNGIRRKYDDSVPDAPIMTCAKLGKVPTDIDAARSLKCSSFVLDAELYEKNKAFLPQGFNPDTINK